MCGITGLVSKTGENEASAIDAIRRMTERMRPRGPDAEGVWAGEGVVLGHRRLAILDLDARANQPMMSADSRYTIVFNGEIYNFRELRRELEADGVVFRTTSDTEVLLALCAREGERMLPRLRGMFALAIWNTGSRELFLARDPYGIKPLYYTRTKDGLLFAPQIKVILASGPMATWLSDATHMRAVSGLPPLTALGTPWARRWARAIVIGMAELGQHPVR